MSTWIRCSCGEMHWGPHGATGLLLTTPDRQSVLLQQRSLFVDHGSTWGIPSGALDTPDEHPYDAALREAEEEHATRATAEQDIGVLGTIPGHTTDEWSFTYVLAEATPVAVVGGDGWEATCHEWVPLADVDKLPLHPSLNADWPMLRERIANTDVDPIVAWRKWALHRDEHGPVLTSPYYHLAPPQLTATLHAVCQYTSHVPPEPGCDCGAYAMVNNDRLYTWLYPADVAARVELLGPIRPGIILSAELFPEVRAASATLLSPAYIHPKFAQHIDALSDRYGIEFQPNPDLARSGVNDLERLANEMLATASRMLEDETAWISQAHKVAPNLYLSGSRHRFPLQPDLLVTLCEPDEVWADQPATRKLDMPWPDSPRTLPASPEQISNLVAEITSTLNANQTVLVRCHWGIERSAFIVALVLMELTGKPVDEVVGDLRRRRTPRVLENTFSPFWSYLRDRDRERKQKTG